MMTARKIVTPCRIRPTCLRSSDTELVRKSAWTEMVLNA